MVVAWIVGPPIPLFPLPPASSGAPSGGLRHPHTFTSHERTKLVTFHKRPIADVSIPKIPMLENSR